jgi:pilus assembly protein CpaB
MRALVLAFLALVVAAGTASLARHRLSEARVEIKQEVKEQAAPTAYVLVAARDLPAGTLLHVEDMTWQSWPDEQTNDAYLRKGRDDPQSLAGSVVRFRIAKGEPVSTGRFIAPGERGFLAAVLEPGTRATTVTLTAATDIAGLILPGDHIDLILSHAIKNELEPNGTPRQVSETILTNIRVVAIDQIVNDQDKKPIAGKTATFEVTPKQAEIIEVAKALGNLTLVLRSAGAVEADTVRDGVVSYTWDSDVSSLIRHIEPGDMASTDVTVLRGSSGNGNGAGGGSGAGGAAPPNLGIGTNLATSVTGAAQMLRGVGGF